MLRGIISLKVFIIGAVEMTSEHGKKYFELEYSTTTPEAVSFVCYIFMYSRWKIILFCKGTLKITAYHNYTFGCQFICAERDSMMNTIQAWGRRNELLYLAKRKLHEKRLMMSKAGHSRKE